MSERRAPLIHPRTMKRAIEHGPYPQDLDATANELRPWIDDHRAGRLSKRREVSTDRAFLAGVFGRFLGYRLLEDREEGAYDLETQGLAGPGAHTMDGAIGWFGDGQPGRVHAVIEMKRATQGLDESGGRGFTPVEQAWNYANRVGKARWIIVSNFRETRLYCRHRAMHEYEVFRLADLDDPREIRRFWLTLGRHAVLPEKPDGTSLLDRLLLEGDQEQEQITERLYKVVKGLRKGLFEDLCRAHSNIPALDHVRHAQKILDRFLFLSFAQDRGLIPPRSIENGLDAEHAMLDIPKWQSLTALCHKVDEGDAKRHIPKLNGGLFARDLDLDSLEVPDATCERIRELSGFDFAEDVSVEVLGHIFEQSIEDLEAMRASAREASVVGVGSRKKHGAFYTPDYVTRYLAESTLKPLLDDLYERCVANSRMEVEVGQRSEWMDIDRLEDELDASIARVRAKALREGKDPDKSVELSERVAAWRERIVEVRRAIWEAWQRALKDVRVLDPACGSGAFLAAAFDVLAEAYRRSNRELEAISGVPGLFDVEETVLHHNLFGVDLNRESVEITKLSLWLKTATDKRPLTWLDGNIQVGDSIVDDPSFSPQAFNWHTGTRRGWSIDPEEHQEAEQIGERWLEGFDVVLGNPPYVRQEWITPIKPHLEQHYATWHGMADLYVYFFERGLQQLKPGGRLAFIVANKWVKGGYAEPLRALLSEHCVVEEVLDFGHAPIFRDADAFPSVLILRKPVDGEAPPPEQEVRVAQLPREELRRSSLPEFIEKYQVHIPQKRFGRTPWSLEPPEVERLMERMKSAGVPLEEYAGSEPMYGVKTGCNAAFLIDQPTRDRLVREDPKSADIIRPYLRGRDVGRWAADWDRQYMIALASSGDVTWPWADASAPEDVFRSHYPAVYAHLKNHEDRLRPRADQGRYWWELRACAYYGVFDKPKVIYQEIQFHPSYTFDVGGAFTNNKCFILPGRPWWLLAALNSPVMWWHNWRYLPHMKDEALSPTGVRMKDLPIPTPTPRQADLAETLVPEVVSLTKTHHESRRELLYWLRHTCDIQKPGRRLTAFNDLSTDDFVAEVQRRRPRKAGRLGPKTLQDVRDYHRSYAESWHRRQARILDIERQLSDLVIEAWQLSPEDVDLLRRTAPPRMPPGLPEPDQVEVEPVVG